jgi:hypothetical protein
MQVHKDANHGRGVVRARLRLLVVGAPVHEPVAVVRPADDGADHDDGVRPGAAVPAVVPLHAADEPAVGAVRHDGGRTVVHPPREQPAVPDHVAHAVGVGAEDVVRQRPRQRQQLVGARRPVGALQRRVGGLGGEVAGVDGEGEGGVGDVLHVVPLPDVEHAAGRAKRYCSALVLYCSSVVRWCFGRCFPSRSSCNT